MIMLGRGGERFSPHWGTSTLICFSRLKMLSSIMKVTFLTLIEVGVKALDDRTLQVTLSYPTPYFLQLLDHYSLFPVHQATIEKFGDADQRGTRWTYEGNLVGNGPFQLVDWKINRRIVVQSNPYYWDADNVSLKEIVFIPIENIVTEERMFRAGSYT